MYVGLVELLDVIFVVDDGDSHASGRRLSSKNFDDCTYTCVANISISNPVVENSVYIDSMICCVHTR